MQQVLTFIQLWATFDLDKLIIKHYGYIVLDDGQIASSFERQ